MTDTTLDQNGEASASRWVKRIAAVTFCLGLFAMLGVVFTRVIAARVPEQRATLEKLIAERTGLAVRFDDVRFAWNLDGASAVCSLPIRPRDACASWRRSCASSSTPGTFSATSAFRWVT